MQALERVLVQRMKEQKGDDVHYPAVNIKYKSQKSKEINTFISGSRLQRRQEKRQQTDLPKCIYIERERESLILRNARHF
jgi:hypothetical protein